MATNKKILLEVERVRDALKKLAAVQVKDDDEVLNYLEIVIQVMEMYYEFCTAVEKNDENDTKILSEQISNKIEFEFRMGLLMGHDEN